MELKKPKLFFVAFNGLGIVFLFIIVQMAVEPVTELLSGSELFLVPFILFCGLGFVLFQVIRKEKFEKRLKIFLHMTAISSFGFFIAIFLHNAFYAFTMLSQNILALPTIFNTLSVIFFLIAIPVCPIVFVVGYIGSIILLKKKPLL